jgi:hypothetical protein
MQAIPGPVGSVLSLTCAKASLNTPSRSTTIKIAKLPFVCMPSGLVVPEFRYKRKRQIQLQTGDRHWLRVTS